MDFKRKLSVSNIISQRVNRIPFTGDFYQAFGNPQDRGVWFVYGNSASGKSTFLMMLAKEFARLKYGVLYNLLEEDPDDSDYIDRVKRLNMFDVKERFHTIQIRNIKRLTAFLKKRRNAKVIIIDSLVYQKISFDEYLEFKRQFRNKILIFVGHGKGAAPRTKIEEDVMYDAKMKIYVSGYEAVCKGRTIGPNGGSFIIWKEGYEQLHGITLNNNNHDTISN